MENVAYYLRLLAALIGVLLTTYVVVSGYSVRTILATVSFVTAACVTAFAGPITNVLGTGLYADALLVAVEVAGYGLAIYLFRSTER